MKQKTLFISTLTALSMAFGMAVAFTSSSKSEVKEADAASHPANFDPYYYSGNYYSGISGTGESLKGQLTKLIFPKGWYSYSGSGSGAIAQILQSADEDPTNPSNMIYFYTRDSVKKNAASSWNREHVWPKALSNNCWGEKNYKSYAGTDLLHLRPTYEEPNSTRGSLKYGNAPNGSTKTYQGITYGKSSGGLFEPLDSVKGDAARICMYIYVAYYDHFGSSSIPALTKVFSSFDTMMEWHIADKPDVMEGHRNDVAESSLQKNRNPFVDHPEYAWQIFGDKLSSAVLEKAKAAYPGDGSIPIDDGGDDEPPVPVVNEKGSVNNPYTVAEALNVLATVGPKSGVFTRGKISSIKEVSPKVGDQGYGNATFSISDDGTETAPQLLVYRGKYLEQAQFTAEDQIKVGDVVVMSGDLINYTDSTSGTVTPEYGSNSFIYSLNAEIPEGWPYDEGGEGGEGGDTPTPTTKVLDKIAVTNLPDKVTYEGGEKFDKKGLIVTATYKDNSTSDVTDKVTISTPNMNKKGTAIVWVTYAEGSIECKTNFVITINSDATGGCGGSVIASSAIISLTSLLGTALLFYKKRKH